MNVLKKEKEVCITGQVNIFCLPNNPSHWCAASVENVVKALLKILCEATLKENKEAA